jgi:hypothetical protein
MATITKGRTFVSGEVVTPAKLNTLVDSATIAGIVDADVSASAGIVDTKLATIATAGKVANSATTATNANTASTIVARDASGNFTAGTITANLTGNVTGAVTGNASTASNLSGNAAKSLCKAWVNFDGTTAGTFAGGASTVSRPAASSTATITTTTAHGLITGNVVHVLTGVQAGAYVVTFLTNTTFSIQTTATTLISGATITFQFANLRNGYNVSSIAKSGNGIYRCNFASLMTSANYVTLVTGSQFSGSGAGPNGIEGDGSVTFANGKTTGQVVVNTGTSTANGDAVSVNVVIFCD